MLIDARSLSANTHLQADLCIVGGGAAGIAIALQFIGKPVKVVLLEAGGTGPDAATQSLYAGENVGVSYAAPEASRCRYLGGSTNCWSGWCRPLDPIDFAARPWMPNSGWPFGREELEPHYERAHELLQLESREWSEDYWRSALATKKNVSFYPIEGDRILNIVDQFSPPARFGKLYLPSLKAASNVHLFLHANVTELETEPSGLRIARIRAATTSGINFSIAPAAVALSAGGIENARLLLASHRTHAQGLGNAYDLVGRYFMDHPAVRSTRVRLADQKRYRRLYDHTLGLTRRRTRHRGLRVAAHFAPSESLQRSASLPNSRTYLFADYYGSSSPAYSALKAIRAQIGDRHKYGTAASDIARAIGRGLPIIVPRAPHVALAILDDRLNPERRSRDFYLQTIFEPIPNPESRVTLSPRRDSLGMNQAKIGWRLTEQDGLNFLSTHGILREELESQGLFVSQQPVEDPATLWPDQVQGCWHHMGTTRMDPDPRKGVVDSDGRVHGIANLFIAGSSVFPTAGSDMPTMTIVALALRLGGTIESFLHPGRATVSQAMAISLPPGHGRVAPTVPPSAQLK